MKPKILPLVWYGVAFSTFTSVVIVAMTILALKPIVAVGAAWLVSIFAAWLVGPVLLAVKPDLRFSTKQQIDGLGYVHQPISVVFYMTVLAVRWGVVWILKR